MVKAGAQLNISVSDWSFQSHDNLTEVLGSITAWKFICTSSVCVNNNNDFFSLRFSLTENCSSVFQVFQDVWTCECISVRFCHSRDQCGCMARDAPIRISGADH